MKKLLLLLSVITLSYASVGKISAIRGDAVVISNGNQTQAVLNQELNENDVIKTSNNARLQVIFNDNTVTTLGKNTSLAIKEYLLDGKNSKVNLEVEQGSFKVITGEISKIARENFSLKANTATIGIRGTVFVGEVGLKVNKLACLQGAIDVKVGNKTSLIDSGKQISFSGAKVVKIEALNVGDFSMTKAEEKKSDDDSAKNDEQKSEQKPTQQPAKQEAKPSQVVSSETKQNDKKQDSLDKKQQTVTKQEQVEEKKKEVEKEVEKKKEEIKQEEANKKPAEPTLPEVVTPPVEVPETTLPEEITPPVDETNKPNVKPVEPTPPAEDTSKPEEITPPVVVTPPVDIPEVTVPSNSKYIEQGSKDTFYYGKKNGEKGAKVDMDKKEIVHYQGKGNAMEKDYANEHGHVKTKIEKDSGDVKITKEYTKDHKIIDGNYKYSDFKADGKNNVQIGNGDNKFVINKEDFEFDGSELKSGNADDYGKLEKNWEKLEGDFNSSEKYVNTIKEGGPKYYKDTRGTGVKVDLNKEYIGAYGRDKYNKELIMSVEKDIIRSKYDNEAIKSEYLDKKIETSGKHSYKVENESKNMALDFTANKGSHSKLEMEAFDKKVHSDELVNSTGSNKDIDNKLKF